LSQRGKRCIHKEIDCSRSDIAGRRLVAFAGSRRLVLLKLTICAFLEMNIEWEV
jgi:hypothetical protein